jgi:hypothetical protein
MEHRHIINMEHQKIEAYSFKSFGFTLPFLIEALHCSHNKMVPSLTIDIAITTFLRDKQILHRHSDFLILG